MGTAPPPGSPALPPTCLRSRILTFWRLLATHSPDQCIRTSKQTRSGCTPLPVETRNTGFCSVAASWGSHLLPASPPYQFLPPKHAQHDSELHPCHRPEMVPVARVTYLANKRYCSQRTRKAVLEGQHALYMTNNLKTDLLLRTGQKRHFHR